MRSWFQDYFARLESLYPDPVRYHRARTVAVLSMGSAAAAVLYMVLITILQRQDVGIWLGYVDPLGLIFAAWISLVLIRNRRADIARWLILGVVFLLGLTILSLYDLLTFAAVYLLVFPLLTSVLFDRRGPLVGIALSLGMLFLLIAGEAVGAFPSRILDNPALSLGTFNIAYGVLLVGLVMWVFSGSLRQTVSAWQRKAQQMQMINEIGYVASSTLESEQLLSTLVEMIRERMVFYHVQIFLLDDTGEQAVLAASTGEAGKKLLARGHSLLVGSRSVVGQAAVRREPYYAPHTGRGSMHHTNEFLPATRSELALPLTDGEQLIGVLDVQSTRPDAFTDDDIEILTVLASQVSVGIRNMRLFEQINDSMAQNRRLYNEAQQRLRAMQELNRQLTEQAWQQYLATSDQVHGVVVDGPTVEHNATWTPTLKQAAQKGLPATARHEQDTVVAVPITIRGQMLGAIEVTLPQQSNAEEAQELLEAVSSRLALALDNSRLFEETRELAQKEHMINAIGERLQTAEGVDDMLQVTLNELSKVLRAEHAAIRLRAAPLTGTTDSKQN